MSFEPVAIVGRACVLPGALTPRALHEAARDGRDLIGAAPEGRWRVRRERILGTPAAAVDRTWSDRGGYVRGFADVFDPEGFGLPSDEVLGLDPLFQWLLHVSRGALRDAGVEGGPRVGATFGNLSFPSASLSLFAERVWLGEELADDAGLARTDPRNRFNSGLPAHLVAHALGLGGGAFCLDAACASSLYAIKLACDRLHDRSADVMVAGAVNCADDLFIHVGFCALQAMSRSGRSRPFHRDADGLVPAEGAGAVVLKRLADAEAAGDRILGVIRGIGLSNDGRGHGLLVPSEEGQVRAMRRAYAAAGLSPRDISLIECHATGTAVGDGAELRSMRRVFEGATGLPIGSLKSNLGHAITAAGVAGLIKLLGALEERVLPPTLHADEPLDDLADSPFRLIQKAEPWEATAPRRAALSAFGFGGNNAHLILEEHLGEGRPRRSPESAEPEPPLHGALTGTDASTCLVRAPWGGGGGGAGRIGSLFESSHKACQVTPPLQGERTARVPAPGRADLHSEALAPGRDEAEVAIVAIGAAVGAGTSLSDFESALFAPPPAKLPRAGSIGIPARGSRFPPRDLAQALPQQTWVLAAAQEALAGVRQPEAERSGVFVGIGCDPEVARYGARWRLADWAKAWGVEGGEWPSRAAEGFTAALEPAGVLGTMPNIPANRLNVQFDFAGQGFTVSSEELSGVRALQLAARAIRTGELDFALVGASDFSCEAVHEAALRGLGIDPKAGDGAVVLALKRAEHARRDGDRILALLAAEENPGTTAFDTAQIEERFGRAHAAFGLVNVAAAALCCARGRKPGGAAWTGERAAQLELDALGGQHATVVVRSNGADPVAATAIDSPAGPVREYPAHHPSPRLPALPSASWTEAAGLRPWSPPEGVQTMPVAPPLPSCDPDGGEPVRASPSTTPPTSTLRIATPPATARQPATLPAAPRTAPTASSQSGSTPQTSTPRTPMMQAPTPPQPPTQPTPAAATPSALQSATTMPLGLTQAMAAQHALLAQVHRQFVESQSAVQQRFLELRQHTANVLLQAAAGSVVPLPVANNPAPIVENPAVTAALGPLVSAPAPAPGTSAVPPSPARVIAATPPAQPAIAPAPTPAPVPSVPTRTTHASSTNGTSRAPSAPPASQAEQPFPGPKLDRRGLAVHASGRISEIFGPQFAQQDGFARQVRMPEPPLLLADRLLGIDAEPGSMGLGTLWSETDVTADAWYLHDGHMPAGVMIESGQADLMLISYLGVDFLNRSDRVYRLLGCDLTYHGALPVPGDTLRYDIHVDGHATHGDVRLFFFHYDCRIGGSPRLSVRNGQAGFFTDGELDDSKGVLWDAETAERKTDPQLDPPAVACERSRFDRAQLESFAAGRVTDCFGPGFEFTSTHTRTPRISGGRMLFLEEVTELSSRGGPWGRGYLRAVDRISPDDWFFEGHFKNDPCMPGTLMFEGCLQAMAFYLTGLGYTLDKDGWVFQPVPEETYKLRCRGQATPRSREVVYEVFVEEVIDGPIPTLWADILVTVDGRKAFYCRRMGLQLVPGWPLDAVAGLPPHPELAALTAPDDGRAIASAGGFRFDYRSLLACAWGRPSEAFGPMYQPFDGTRRVPRLPGPPYHFISRIVRTEGELGAMQVGTTVEAEYDIPADAWYFDENGAPTMPFCVLLEAALQPCGWLASYVGSAVTSDTDLFFRNLDGTGRVLGELLPGTAPLRTHVTLTNISQSAGMIIESFDVRCTAGGAPIYELKTVFGFFPKEALAAQKGLPIPDEERRLLAASSEERVELGARPERWFGAGARLATERLLVLDRVSGIWPAGGKAGLGQYRGEMDVDASAWFFKAHFFQDPVQPGSLGIEALIELLQFAMIHSGLADGLGAEGRFEPIAIGLPMTWKYRGQVVPRNKRITTLIEIVRTGEDERGRFAIADGSLWVDGVRIYEAKGLGMRVVRDDLPSRPRGGGVEGPRPTLPEAKTEAPSAKHEEVLDPATQGWLADHCPTWTFPALPLMSMVDRLAAAAARQAPGMKVIGVENAKAHRWLPLRGPVRLQTEVVPAGDGAFDVTLLAWRESRHGGVPSPSREAALGEGQGEGRRGCSHGRTKGRESPNPALSRFEPVASGRVRLARDYPPATESALPPPADALPVPDPYVAGTLFHGPAFQLLRSLARGASGASAILDCATEAPTGELHQVLLDALTHGIPHDALTEWAPELDGTHVAYPHRIAALNLHGPLPRHGQLRCETRFAGFDGDARFPRFKIQAIADGSVVATMELVEVLVPKGPLGAAAPAERRAFLRDRQPVPGLRLSQADRDATRLSDAEVFASDWLPGTVASVYAATGPDLALEVAVKEHVAARAHVHPATVHLEDGGLARCDAEPLTSYRVNATRRADSVKVSDAGPPKLDLAPVRAFWDRYFQLGRWPVEDVFYGLAERFVSRVRLADPVAFAKARGRGVLYLGNHQVAVESLMFSVLASALTGVETITLAKAEHRTSWLGRLIKHSFAYPGARDPGVITFFDRDAREQLPEVLAELAGQMQDGGKSVMVHIEGTRSLSCRTPVVKMSGAFLDMAIATGAPVVPVRFIGGLPVEPLDARIEFPVGMGRQEIHLGAPIEPRELAALNYKERKQKVIDAINSLGQNNAEETPAPGDPEFAAAAEAWTQAAGASHEHAVLFETLRRLQAPCAGTKELLEAAETCQLATPDDDKGRWMAELARRLFGDRRPTNGRPRGQ